MRPLAVALLLVLASVAGCLADAEETRNVWTVSGRFTKDATQEDLTALGADIEALNGSLAVMESFPMQYVADLPTEMVCEEARSILRNKTYVAATGDCAVRTVSVDPGTPVSNG